MCEVNKIKVAREIIVENDCGTLLYFDNDDITN